MFEKCASPILRFILSRKAASHHKLVENSGVSARLWPLKGCIPWASWNIQQSTTVWKCTLLGYLRTLWGLRISFWKTFSSRYSFYVCDNISYRVWVYFLWWNSSRKVISELAPNLSTNLNELIQVTYLPSHVPSKPSIFCHTVQVRDEVSD